ncbi:DUF6009 family protein [Streptomyces kunmingensis]|uniref:DUF6009 family protein n=1 Tax=Streptomyces kunmingensis TaxID=68225 RepID=A0ABU6CE53_9ACTN|nr:DUF6009 family protein [Streptomyces kunmingensis]MEB3962988.1 DUF6009 family protein [Streptomyces kunmingensis]
MSSLLTDGDLCYEERVVWLEDLENLDYVRQAIDKTTRRRSRPGYARDGRIVGYAELGDQASADPESGLYRRRVFFLLPHDRDALPDGVYRRGAPGEAVDPRTVDVQKTGGKTSRSQGGDMATADAPVRS